MARKEGISGKETTPYLLKSVVEMTEGRSLEANIALVKNNARVAAELAIKLI
jgi:pseudouridine-5'-phosphate glycosidase